MATVFGVSNNFCRNTVTFFRNKFFCFVDVLIFHYYIFTICLILLYFCRSLPFLKHNSRNIFFYSIQNIHLIRLTASLKYVLCL